MLEKPRLRGVFHLWAFFVAVVAGVVLVALADGALSRFAAWVYVTALAAMFGASALYHRYPFKSSARRIWARRLDHSTIFLFIAGTYTPFALLAFNGTISWVVLATVWGGAALGLVLNFFWLHAPRWVSVLAYIGVGWVGVVTIPQMFSGAGRRCIGTRGRRRRALHARRDHLRTPLAEPVPGNTRVPRDLPPARRGSRCNPVRRGCFRRRLTREATRGR